MTVQDGARESGRGARRMPAQSYVVYLRRIWSHPYADENVPWPRILALMWLIQYAQFAERVKHYRGHRITVPAGHFVASVRMLATRFRWSNPKVLRFLDELVRDETLCTVGVTPAGTLYRFVNWELHQPASSGSVTVDVNSNVHADVHRDGTKRSNGKKGEERTTWLTPYLTAWTEQFGTDYPASRLAGEIRSVHGQLGPDECLVRWRRYLSATTDVQYATGSSFARTHTRYSGDSVTGNLSGNGAQPLSMGERVLC